MVKKEISELIDLRNYLNIEEEAESNYIMELENDLERVNSDTAKKYIKEVLIRENGRLYEVRKIKREVTQRINKLEMSKND